MAWKASFTQGVSSFRASRLDEALNHFTLALTSPGGEQQHVIYDSRAAVYEKLGMPKEALRDAKAVITLAQDLWQGYARSARLFFLAHRYEAALQMANMALQRVKSTNTTRRAEILKLRNEILEAQRAEKQHRAAQNQIEKLPVELLGEIFRMVIRNDVAELIGVLRVCRYWRNVAWHAPILWETLVLTTKSPVRKLSLWLNQSKGRIRELDIRAGVASHVDWPFQGLKEVPWDKLRVCKAVSWDVAGFLEKHGLVPYGFATLETLELTEERWSQRRASSSLFPLLQAAGVRSLSFCRSEFSWTQLSTHLTTLTTLRIENSSKAPSDLLLALEANPGLETLIIEDHMSYNRPADAVPVCLLHLKRLEFWGSWASRLLEVISAPALELLNIKGSQDTLDVALSTLMAAHDFTKLRHLAIGSSPVTPAVIIRLLKHAPALTHLELIYLSKGPNAVIEALAGPSPVPLSPGKRQLHGTAGSTRTSDEHILCPALTHLNLSASPDLRTGPLVRLVRARLPLPPTPPADDASPSAADLSVAAINIDKPQPTHARCARILGLTLDGCDHIEADWLPWFRKNVPAVSCVFNSKKKAVWR